MAWWLAWVNMLLYIKWSSTTCISLYDDTLSFNDKQMPKMSLSVLLCLSFYLSQHAPVSLIIMVMNPYWHVFSVLLAIEAKCVGPGFIIYTKKWAPMNERLRTTLKYLHVIFVVSTQRGITSQNEYLLTSGMKPTPSNGTGIPSLAPNCYCTVRGERNKTITLMPFWHVQLVCIIVIATVSVVRKLPF